MVGGITVAALLRFFSQDLPDPNILASHRPSETTRIYARDGQTVLYEFFQGGQRTLIPLAEIPWELKAATIAVEDADFYNNPGVDLRGILRALYLNRNGEVRSGGSTITQQLARNVLLSEAERGEQSYRRKIREAILALHISRTFSKEQILGLYLNEIYYGNMAYGVEAAAQSYFGHSARTLSLAEAALLAGLPQSPTTMNPVTDVEAAKARQKVVLDLMVKQGYLDQAQADAAHAEPLQLRPASVDIRYPHWVFYVRDLIEQQLGPDLLYRGGLQVITTLDPQLQEIAQRSVQTEVATLAERNAHNGAVVVMDARTAEILAMVGSADYNNGAIDGQVNVALAPRQPGSTLKPLVYAAALAADWTPATVIWDTPTDFGGGYRPQNYDNQFHGPQRLRLALAGSLNIPAVKALEHVGLDAFLDLAHRMGITTLQDRERYGLAIALGAGEARLLDLVAAYGALANAGRARSPVALLRVTTGQGEILVNHTPEEGRPIFGRQSAQIAFLISDILSDNDARTPIFGPNSVMRLDHDRPAAVKTGTSNDFKDSWAVGYTPELVVGAWVGNNDGSAMHEVAGANGAGRIWRTVMEQAHVDRPPLPFSRPEGIVELPICASTGAPGDGCADQVPERFLAGTQPGSDGASFVTVTVGEDGTCLATEATPPDRRRTAVFLQPPTEARDWATGAGLAQPPTTPCPPPGQIHATTALTGSVRASQISSPRMGERVGGEVSIWGTAAGTYRLDYGEGDDPQSWTPITIGAGGIEHGLIGQWSTAGLPQATYTIRLLVALPGTPQQESRVRVQMDPDSLSVRLLEPAPGVVVPEAARVVLSAEASGPVARVELLVDGDVIAAGQGAHADGEWIALGVGEHTLVAEAIRPDGARVRSQPAPIQVR